MPEVAPRASKDFVVRRVIIEKVVERRLGHESDDPPEGWHWDEKYLIKDVESEHLPAPGLKESHLLKVPKEYWDNGPPDGRRRDHLKVDDVIALKIESRDQWVPKIHRGPVNIWRDAQYLFSDDSVIERVAYDSHDENSHSTHTLERVLRTDSPVMACIYRRIDGENFPWWTYVQRHAFSGTLDSDGEELTTRSGDVIYWDNIDTTKKEFIPYFYDGYIRLLFNQDTVESITSAYAPSVIADFNDLEYVGETTGENGQVLYSEYYPISDDTFLSVYVVDTSTSTWTEYDVVTSFTGADQAKVDYDLGRITFGSYETGGEPPDIGQGVYLRYRAVPRIEYEEEGYGDYLTAKDVDVSPNGQALNRGFVALSRSELDPGEIILETTTSSYPGDLTSYGPVYVGSDYAPMTATVFSESGDRVPNAKVSFTILSSPMCGSLDGTGIISRRITDFRGEARATYVPPVSASELGTYVFSVGDSNSLTVSSDLQFDDPTEVYTYYVLKDDPFLGKVDADTDLGEIEWQGAPPNGRKVVLYKWDTSAINPVSGHLGAYSPVRPSSVSGGNVLYYDDTLAEPDSTSSDTNLGAYWVVSDRYLSIQASVYSERRGRTLYSNILTFRIQLPDYMKGSYVSEALEEIPFGWRLTGEGYDVASAINGATYITINPVAGPYPIVDIIGGETWDYIDDFWPYGAYPTSGASYPFAVMSVFWNIVT